MISVKIALALALVPAIASAQPAITAASTFTSCGGNSCAGATSTVPGANGNWQMWLSTTGLSSFQANPLTGIQLSLGTNTIYFASALYPANPMALNLFLDGATLGPQLSGIAREGALNSLIGNNSPSSYTPFGYYTQAGGLSYSSDGYLATLTRMDYQAGGDVVSFNSPNQDGYADWNGSFDVTVTSATPEPASMVLTATGLLAVAGIVRRKKIGIAGFLKRSRS